jgi:signal transduction histidine kinase
MVFMPFPDTAGPGTLLPWTLLLALPLVAGLAYALGAARARHRLQRDLRLAREDLRCEQQLQGRWQWQTDDAHRLLHWVGPGLPPATGCALFNDAGLQALLRGQQPIAALRIEVSAPVDDNLHWELQAQPRWTDTGMFNGYRGSARPLDAEEALQWLASTSTALLAALPGPALLLRATLQGWVLHQANEAGRALWPAGLRGRLVQDAGGALPAAVQEALAAALQSPPAAPQDLGGWRLAPGSTGASLLLCAPGPAPSAAPPAERSETERSESDAFSFTLSHDLRTPIRVVEGFTRIVKEDYGRLLDRVGNDHLDRVLSAAARMNLMIDALLTLAQLSQQPLARQRVNLSQLAGFVVDELKRSAPDRDAEFDITPGLTATGDPTLLRLVLENLLGNAFKYSAKVAPARISLLAGPVAAQDGGKLSFVVRDNGAGFDMRSADRLFGLFQRLHSAGDFAGHGVGLASVRRIVQRHGGQIWAESEPGRGAAFFFTLPA